MTTIILGVRLEGMTEAEVVEVEATIAGVGEGAAEEGEDRTIEPMVGIMIVVTLVGVDEAATTVHLEVRPTIVVAPGMIRTNRRTRRVYFIKLFSLLDFVRRSVYYCSSESYTLINA